MAWAGIDCEYALSEFPIQSILEGMPAEQIPAAIELLSALPARSPLRQWVDSLKPGRKAAMERVLRLALMNLNPEHSELFQRAARNVGSLSLEERRALALALDSKWWFDSEATAISRTDALVRPLRVATAWLDQWVGGRGHLNSGNIEDLLDPRQRRGIFIQAVRTAYNAIDRNSALRELAQTILASPAQGRERLRQYFVQERIQLEKALGEESAREKPRRLREAALRYQLQRLSQLNIYLEIPPESWREAERFNPRYQQFLFESLPEGFSAVESAALAAIPLALLGFWVQSKAEDREAERAERERVARERIETVPDLFPGSSNRGFTSATPASVSGVQNETPEQTLRRRLNSEEIDQAEYDRLMEEVGRKNLRRDRSMNAPQHR